MKAWETLDHCTNSQVPSLASSRSPYVLEPPHLLAGVRAPLPRRQGGGGGLRPSQVHLHPREPGHPLTSQRHRVSALIVSPARYISHSPIRRTQCSPMDACTGCSWRGLGMGRCTVTCKASSLSSSVLSSSGASRYQRSPATARVSLYAQRWPSSMVASAWCETFMILNMPCEVWTLNDIMSWLCVFRLP